VRLIDVLYHSIGSRGMKKKVDLAAELLGVLERCQIQLQVLQGYLAHKKLPPPGTSLIRNCPPPGTTLTRNCPLPGTSLMTNCPPTCSGGGSGGCAVS